MLKVLIFGRKKITINVLRYLLKSKSFEIIGLLTNESSAVEKFAKKNNIKLFDEKSLVEKRISFDLGLSILFWKRIKKNIIKISKMGIINFHPAPLPDYKGTAGYNLAILESLEKWGVSSHFIDESIDTGPIISVKKFDINAKEETVSSLEKKSLVKMEEQVFEVLELILKNKIRLSKNIGGRYISRKEMEAMKEIKEGDDIDRKIRAFWYPPYDGAYIKIKGEKYTLVNRKILENLPTDASGTIYLQKDNK